jgi:hypothetical protein
MLWRHTAPHEASEALQTPSESLCLGDKRAPAGIVAGVYVARRPSLRAFRFSRPVVIV